MATLNKVQLIGNAGRDAEIRRLPTGMAVANVSIATTTKRKNKTTGEYIEDTQWHRITFYDKLAEIAEQYIKKGKQVYIEGRLKYGVYTDKTTGIEKTSCDIIATELQLLSAKDQSDFAGQRPQEGQPQRQERPKAAPAPSSMGSGFDEIDSDVPF